MHRVVKYHVCLGICAILCTLLSIVLLLCIPIGLTQAHATDATDITLQDDQCVGDSLNTMVLSHDDSTLYTLNSRGTICKVNAATLQVQKTVQLRYLINDPLFTRMMLTQDDRQLIINVSDRLIVLNTQSLSVAHEYPVNGVWYQLSSDQQKAYILEYDSGASSWRLTTLVLSSGQSSQVPVLAEGIQLSDFRYNYGLSSEGKQWYVGARGGNNPQQAEYIAVIDIADGKLHTLQGPVVGLSDAAVDTEHKSIVVSYFEEKVHKIAIIDTKQGTIKTIDDPNNGNEAISISGNGEKFATLKSAKFWNISGKDQSIPGWKAKDDLTIARFFSPEANVLYTLHTEQPPELESLSDGGSLAVSLVAYPLLEGSSAITSKLSYTMQSITTGAAMSNVIVSSDGKAAYATHDGAASYSNGQEVLPEKLDTTHRAALVRIDISTIQDDVQGKASQQGQSSSSDSKQDGLQVDSQGERAHVQQQGSVNTLIIVFGVCAVIVAVCVLVYWLMRQRGGRHNIHGDHTRGGNHSLHKKI